VTLKCENALVGSKLPKEFEMEVSDNITLWRLKLMMCDKLGGENPQKVALFRMKKLLERRQHGKSLKDLNISSGDVIRVETANVDELPKCHLLDEPAGIPTAKFEKVLRKWWKLFSHTVNGEEVMTVDDLVLLFK